MKALQFILIFILICTGQNAFSHPIVHVNRTGLLVFSRENSCLPYWEVKGSKQQYYRQAGSWSDPGPASKPETVTPADPERIVTPPKGFESGYVPIV
jgi:hypothetical protein